MSPPTPHLLRFKPFSFLLLLLLAIAIALIWRSTHSPDIREVSVNDPMEMSLSADPLQPIPDLPALNTRKVALGNQLFNEVRLSQTHQISCASCHNLQMGGVDGTAKSTGVNGTLSLTNTPTVFNSRFNFRLHWDGRFETLAQQADGMITDPILMGGNWSEILKTLQQIPDYQQAFSQLYRDGLTQQTVTDAIATFEASLSTPNSRFDRFLQGDTTALSPVEQQGYRLFKDYGCASCHQGVNIGGNLFQKFGVMGDYFAQWGTPKPADLGRFNVTGRQSDRFVFRVPSLRNVALTAPYFHNGAASTLPKAVAVMARYQLGRPLEDEQVEQLVQFLNTLTGEYEGKPL